MATLDEAAAYLAGLINVERSPDFRRARLSLEPIRQLLGRANISHANLAALHIAGSKGKGSTALLAEGLLRARGLRVGTFTSPHLSSWTERFRIDGEEVPGEALAEVVERLRPEIDALRDEHPEDAPSFFDATTAAALALFADAEVDHAVLEVGLGGRLDSTNVVTPAVTCVTSIELEHTEKLGTSLAAIAREKAGIAKPGVPLVMGALPAEAAAVVEERAEGLGCELARYGSEFWAEILDEDLDGQRVRFREGSLVFEARLAVAGAHQARNAALALACVRRLGAIPDAELAAVAGCAFAAARLPARIELLSCSPWVVVDAAHTAASAEALARTLARIPRRRGHLVLSVSIGKDLAAICRSLVPFADELTITRAEPIRSLAAEEMTAAVRSAAAELAPRVEPDPELAVRAAREALGPEDLLCVAGSVYLAGIARRVLLDERAVRAQARPSHRSRSSL
jgi:dihydrofolate synthase/folylpolyglutamate synthase